MSRKRKSAKMDVSDADIGETSEMGDASTLEHDASAYVFYHKAETESSCLSFDVIRDNLGDNRESFPLSCYIVAGTQTPSASTNRILVMKMGNLHKTLKDDTDNDDESSDDEEGEDDKKAELDIAAMKHNDCVNRIRVTVKNETYLAASWSAYGTVYLWDLTRPMEAVNDPLVMSTYTRNNESPRSLFLFSGHLSEGYSMDWSPSTPGQLLTGDCRKNIHLWVPKEGGQWTIDQRPFVGHSASIEDIQWSPNESTVFASCSVDKSIRVWDTRAAPDKACMLKIEDAHSMDINVMSWNKNEPFFVTGGDDSIVKIWDLRQFEQSVALFKYHTGPITSVEWHPTDSSVFAASSSDDKLTIWDLAVEKDEEQANTEDCDVPPQLLFVHQGQKEVKELHWHPQIPGVIISTAVNGFNIFKTISV